MGPVGKALRLPVPGDLAAGHCVDDQRSFYSIIAAVNIGVRSTIDWVLFGNQSDRGRVNTSTWKVSLVVLSVDNHLRHEAMSVYEWNERDGSGKEREEDIRRLHYQGRRMGGGEKRGRVNLINRLVKSLGRYSVALGESEERNKKS